MTEPFDPHKIPLITVHGLLSSPITWINLQNDLMDDPVVRQHYQIWHFFYPAGLPILVSAQLFREKLAELYNFFDPHGQLPALQNAVVIAHSMGGLLAKTSVSDSGDRLWERTFHKPPADLELSAALREQLDRLLMAYRAQTLSNLTLQASTPAVLQEEPAGIEVAPSAGGHASTASEFDRETPMHGQRDRHPQA